MNPLVCTQEWHMNKDGVHDDRHPRGCYSYDQIVASFGFLILHHEEEDDYQGDSWYLLQDGDRYGYLVFGWGSCSGCDALEGCDTQAEVEELRQELVDAIHWDTAAGLLAYFRDKDWSTEFYSGEGEFTRFRTTALVLLGLAANQQPT